MLERDGEVCGGGGERQTDSVCVVWCVCEREKEREGENSKRRDRGRERKKESVRDREREGEGGRESSKVLLLLEVVSLSGLLVG